MRSPYGPYFLTGAGSHLETLRRLQPRVANVLDPNVDDVRAFKAVCPNTKIVGRLYRPDSEVEERIRANPEQAAQWAHDLANANSAVAAGLIDWVAIANEVCQFWDTLPLLSRFEVARMKLEERVGRGCGIGAFSVGQPDLPANDRLALWRQVYPMLTHADRSQRRHVLLIHQYGAPDLYGPAEKGGAPWLINRFEVQVLPNLPFKSLGIVVQEYGRDGLLLNDLGRSVFDPAEYGVGVRTPSKDEYVSEQAGLQVLAQNSPPRGWQVFATAAEYTAELIQMAQWTAQFSDRILGYCLFCVGVSSPWETYNHAGAVLEGLADHYSSLPEPAPVVPPPPVVVPPVKPPTLVQRLQAEFGSLFKDRRASLPKHKTLKYKKRTLTAVNQIVLHHTATPEKTTWEQVAEYHVGSRGWPGIAYHAGIRRTAAGYEVSLLHDLETISYHAGNANAYSIAICVAGNYETLNAPDELWQQVLRVESVIEAHLGRTLPTIGHRDAAGAQTACPGAHLDQRLKPSTPNPLPEDSMDVKLGSYVDDFNLIIIPFEQRPDAADWKSGPYYRIKQVFTTRDGSWEPSTELGSIDQWAVNEWWSGAKWKGAGGTNNFFIMVLDKTGQPMIGKGLYWWQKGKSPAEATDTKETWQDGTENLPVWNYYDPSIGDTGSWSGTTVGRADVLAGVDLPYKIHTSTFVVMQETDAEPQPEYKTLAESVKGEAERNDVLRVNPAAALCKAAAAAGFWPTSNEYQWTYAGVSYTGQRFRNPANDAVTSLYCVTGQWSKVLRQDW